MATNNSVNSPLSGTTGTGSFVGSNSPQIATPLIVGSNGFTVATFADVASSVDYFSFRSGVSNDAEILINSSNSNASFSIFAKGSGGVQIGTANGGASGQPMALYNGTYTFGHSIPTQTANRTLTYPDANVTLPANPMFTQVNVQRVTASGSGTYTPTSGMQYVIVRAQAGGGGAGGAATTTAGNAACASGGGGGEYIEALFTAAQIGASKSFSVGAGGNGGSAGNNNGNNGSNTTFNTTYIVATGGVAGSGGASTAGTTQITRLGGNGGSGGSVATGTLLRQVPGSYGLQAAILGTGGIPGAGGSSGSGGGGANISLLGTSNPGVNAVANSGGGGSGAATSAGTQAAGGNGGSGFIEFIEFISV